MRFVLDLRYLVPPLISLGKPWAQNLNLNGPIFVIACLFLAILILLFLFTSVKLPVTLRLEPLRLRAGRNFFVTLVLASLASLFYPSSLFWYVFPMLVILSLCYEMLLDQLKRFSKLTCRSTAPFLQFLRRRTADPPQNQSKEVEVLRDADSVPTKPLYMDMRVTEDKEKNDQDNQHEDKRSPT